MAVSRRRYLSLAVMLGLLGCSPRPQGDFRPFAPGCPAEPYVAELAELVNPEPYGGGSLRAIGPDGSTLTLVTDEGFLANASWHSVMLHRPNEPPKCVLRIREGDPGSGTSFGFAWSRDGRAAFIWGRYSGIGDKKVRGGDNGGWLRVIHTLGDGVSWVLPAQNRTIDS